MRLIITRPRADALPLAAKLQTFGHECIILPLLEIVSRQNLAVPPGAWQGICISSANGVANAKALHHLRDTSLYCVGPQSATAATAQGFSRVVAQGGDIAGLSAYMIDHLQPDQGPILYLSGSTTSGDLEGKLTAAGFTVTRLITYDAVAENPVDLQGALDRADGVLLYSQRSAALWLQQVEKLPAKPHMANIMHYCLSPAVAQKLPSNWQRRVANTPDEEAMLALFNRT